jgi:mercuric ion transport protein
MQVRCPDCAEAVVVPAAAKPGELVECPNCAGHALRLKQEGERWTATLAYRVSCPTCDEVLTLAEDAKTGVAVESCGRGYRLTFEYGAFAAEEAQEEPMWRDRWFALGIVGALASCLACLTPAAVVVLGAIGLGAWAGRLDAILLPMLVAFLALAAYRYWVGRRPTS